MTLILRGHHLLCIQGFQGYGYDETFIKNMDYIKSLINKNNIQIKVIDSDDDICKFCPNLTKENICKDSNYNNNIKKMDNVVIKKLNLNENKLDSKKLFDKINTLFKSKDDIKLVCGNCSWLDKCLWVKKF